MLGVIAFDLLLAATLIAAPLPVRRPTVTFQVGINLSAHHQGWLHTGKKAYQITNGCTIWVSRPLFDRWLADGSKGFVSDPVRGTFKLNDKDEVIVIEVMEVGK